MKDTELKEKQDNGYIDLMHLLENIETEEDEEQENYFDIISSVDITEYDTTEEFNRHQRTIRHYIIEEYRNKMLYRKISFWSIIGITGSLLIFIYVFLFVKSST